MHKTIIIFFILILVRNSSGFKGISPRAQVKENYHDLPNHRVIKPQNCLGVDEMKSESISPSQLQSKRAKLQDKSWMINTGKSMCRMIPSLSLLILTLCFFPRNVNASVPQIASSIPKLALKEMSVAFSILLTVSLSLKLLRVGSLPKQLLLASCRCGAQVYIMGAAILSFFFQNNKPGMFVLWLLTVSFIAANETSTRVKHTYPNFPIHVLFSLILGTGSILFPSILGVIKPNPWWNTKILIPIGGLLLGNILSAVSLCSGTLLEELSEGSEKVEQLLCMGATSMEASRPALTKALTTALTPTINSLSACGTIHIPGMMNGQLLAGNNARAAAMYQIVAMYLIAASAGTTTLILSSFISSSVFDRKRHLIRPFLIKRRDEKNQSVRGLLPRIFAHPRQLLFGNETTSLPKYSIYGKNSSSNNDENGNIPCLKVENVTISRTNHIVSFDLYKGQRIALTGNSGIGKSQLLRTLTMLESSSSKNNDGMMTLFETENHIVESFRKNSSPSTCLWRQRVCYIPQIRPTMPGTPRDFHEQIQTLDCRKQQSLDEPSTLNVTDIARDWSLPDDILDRPWSTLSGGQAQRIYLAIVISFKPLVLLMDEPTSACDEATILRIEKTLMDHDTTLIMATHNTDQIERFFTHRIHLREEDTDYRLVKN